jgi:hypothetical protein
VFDRFFQFAKSLTSAASKKSSPRCCLIETIFHPSYDSIPCFFSGPAHETNANENSALGPRKNAETLFCHLFAAIEILDCCQGFEVHLRFFTRRNGRTEEDRRGPSSSRINSLRRMRTDEASLQASSNRWMILESRKYPHHRRSP